MLSPVGLIVLVRNLQPGDVVVMDNKPAKVSAIEWTDGFIQHGTTARAVKVSFVGGATIIVHPCESMRRAHDV